MEALGSVTKAAALSVLDASWLQQKVLASNIANQGTPGYEALTVDFRSFLAELEGAVSSAGSADDRKSAIDAIGARVVSTGKQVELDSQAAELAKNSLQYQAVLTSLMRLQSLNRIAVSGGAA
ncbi:MAG: flagellar basal body rod protein FlgB [Hypericibacter sp.]